VRWHRYIAEKPELFDHYIDQALGDVDNSGNLVVFDVGFYTFTAQGQLFGFGFVIDTGTVTLSLILPLTCMTSVTFFLFSQFLVPLGPGLIVNTVSVACLLPQLFGKVRRRRRQ